MPLKVLLIDDSAAVQRSFAALLSAIPNVEVSGCAEDLAGAIAAALRHRPHVAVVDVELRGGDRGLDVLLHLRRDHPATEVVMLTNHTGASMRRAALNAGALAYFDKANEFKLALDWVAVRASRLPH